MSSTSQKHRNFVAESMGDKPVTELPGIGDEYAKRFQNENIHKAYRVLGQFLVLNKDETSFKQWLMHTCGANSSSQDACFKCLKDWCNQHL